MGAVDRKKKPYKFEPVLAAMLLNKFVDVPIVHPF